MYLSPFCSTSRLMNALRIITALFIFSLLGCNFFDLNGDVNGSVFIVTAGDGSYKLGLVKVYFCLEDDIKKALDPIAAEFPKQDELNFQAAIKGENDNSDALRSEATMVAKVGESLDGLKKIKTEADESNQKADEFADMMEKLEGMRGHTVYLHNPGANTDDKIKIVQNYFHSQVAATSDEAKGIQLFINYYGAVCNDYLKAKKAYEDADATAKIAVDAQVPVGKKFADLKTTLADYPKSQAIRCLEQVTTAKFIAETDADGLFKIRIPKKGRFVILASAHRTVGTDQEVYWWIVPFRLDDQTSSNITLSNDNELFVKDGAGAKVIDLRSKYADHVWKTYTATGEEFKKE